MKKEEAPQPLSKEDISGMLDAMRQEDVIEHAAFESSIDFSRVVDIQNPSGKEMIAQLLRAEDNLERDYGLVKISDRPSQVELEKYLMDNLERAGASLLRGVFFLLAASAYPAATRDLVLALVTISGGNYTEEKEITEDTLRQYTGWSKGVIRRKRRLLEAHEKERGISLIPIQEGEMDYSVMRFSPTKYQVRITHYAARLIRLTRNKAFWKVIGKKELVSRAETEEGQRLAEEACHDAPSTAIKRRMTGKKKQSQEKHYETLIDRMQSDSDKARDRMLIDLEEYLTANLQIGVSPIEALNRIQPLIREMTDKYIAAFEGKGQVSELRIALGVETVKKRRGNGANVHP